MSKLIAFIAAFCWLPTGTGDVPETIALEATLYNGVTLALQFTTI